MLTQLFRYSLAVVACAVALAANLLLTNLFGQQTPLLLFGFAVLVAAWYGGLGPGLVATILSTLVSGYFFIAPAYSFMGIGKDVRLGLFLLGGMLISWLSAARRRAEAESAQLLVREQQARRHAEAAERRAALLADASAVLATSLDYNSTLAELAQLAVPRFADWCAIELTTASGALRRIASARSERITTEPVFSAAINTEKIPTELITALAQAPAHFQTLAACGLRSAISVPIVARNRVLGVIIFAISGHGVPGLLSDKGYDEDALALAQELARRAGLAIDNARLYQEAQQANLIKDEFLSTVSHELRTPLTAMLGWAKLLRSEKLDDKDLQRALEVIERNAEAQAQLIEDLLDVSRIITGHLRITEEPLDMAETVRTVVDSLRPAAQAKQLDLRMETVESMVAGDGRRLQQVVWNLLSNAIKFTPQGGRVEIRLAAAHADIELSVSDNGQGIAADFLPYVFDRFRQADSSSTRVHGGLGLGLAIVRHLVELHGGSVSAHSAGEGQGATFTVRLPRAAASTRQRDTNREKVRVSLERLQILVVDDDTDALAMLSKALNHHGAAVTTATSVVEALGALERCQPDVLVSDIAMPELDGYELIRRIRARTPDRGGAIPALALTAYAKDEDRQRALHAGFHLFAAKPIEPAQLVTMIANLAGRE